jgi:hypothetical protein
LASTARADSVALAGVLGVGPVPPYDARPAPVVTPVVARHNRRLRPLATNPTEASGLSPQAAGSQACETASFAGAEGSGDGGEGRRAGGIGPLGCSRPRAGACGPRAAWAAGGDAGRAGWVGEGARNREGPHAALACSVARGGACERGPRGRGREQRGKTPGARSRHVLRTSRQTIRLQAYGRKSTTSLSIFDPRSCTARAEGRASALATAPRASLRPSRGRPTSTEPPRNAPGLLVGPVGLLEVTARCGDPKMTNGDMPHLGPSVPGPVPHPRSGQRARRHLQCWRNSVGNLARPRRVATVTEGRRTLATLGRGSLVRRPRRSPRGEAAVPASALFRGDQLA